VLREGRLLARVRHPNVVTVYGAQEHEGLVGIWMELVRGRSLAAIVREDGPMGPEEATVTAVSVCRALAAVHAAQLVHRDVKAQNVMREAGGRIVLMDFGSGWELTRATHGGTLVPPTGTPLYMAPELFAGVPPSVGTDLYSVGVLLFYLVTGHHPVDGPTVTDIVIAHGLGRRRLLTDLRPDLPQGFVTVVERALSLSPPHRPATAGVLIQELLQALPGTPAALVDPATDTPRSGPVFEPVTPGSGPAAAAAVAPPRETARTGARAWVLGIGGAAAGTWLLGLLTSFAFDTTLGRGRFSSDTVFSWWIWGLRSLVLPVAVVVLALGSSWILRLAWLLLRLVPRLRRAADRLREGAARAARALRIDTPRAAGQALVVTQLVALASFCVHYRDLIAAFMAYVSTSAPARLAPLAPGNELARDNYRTVLPLLILGMVLAWRRVWRWQRERGQPGDRGAIAIGLLLVAASVGLLTVPYRIFRHSDFPRVAFAHQRCYAIGEQGQELLLFCPDGEVPRNRVVQRDDPSLEPTMQVESIFTPPPSGAPGPGSR
jgi:hypothetical protein